MIGTEAENRYRFTYRAYGLSIGSNLQLGLSDENWGAGGAVETDLRILRAPLDHCPKSQIEIGERDWWLRFSAVGTFAIRGTDTIIVDPEPGVEDRLIALPLNGVVMAMLLLRRGALVLHAGAVIVNGRAVTFLGDKAAGKSTTTAAFVAAGHPLMGDDVAAFSVTPEGQAMLHSGLLQMKLSEDAAAAMRLDSQVVPSGALHPAIRKEQHHLRQEPLQKAVPAGLFCILRRGKNARLTRVPPAQALAELIRFGYAAQFGSSVLPSEIAARYFRQCAAVSSRYDVAMLDVPNSIDRLDEVVRLVEKQLLVSY